MSRKGHLRLQCASPISAKQRLGEQIIGKSVNASLVDSNSASQQTATKLHGNIIKNPECFTACTCCRTTGRKTLIRPSSHYAKENRTQSRWPMQVSAPLESRARRMGGKMILAKPLCSKMLSEFWLFKNRAKPGPRWFRKSPPAFPLGKHVQ